MSKKMGELWPADPHTMAKITILKAYLNAWFPILGRSRRGETILYVDGFAGPGEYENGVNGSPIAALESASTAISTDQWIGGDIHCVFVERAASHHAHLREVLARRARSPRIHAQAIRGEFADVVKQLQQEMPASFQTQSPLFVFVDPFGATGVPFGVVAEILASPTSEVLINFDADGVTRIYEAGKHANHEQILDSIFGGVEWRDSLQRAASFAERCQRATELYMQKLRSIDGIRYVFRFEMRDKADRLSYYLIFASREPLGLEKMKEAMRAVDRSGQYCFSDGAIGQGQLFKFDDPREHAIQMHAAMLGRRLTWEELRDYVLNETPFIKPSVILEKLEDEGMIAIEAGPTRRRLHQFTEDTIRTVSFIPKPVRFGGLFDGD